MGYSNLPSATVTVPFVAGLNTKGDKRAKNPPALDICVDAEFDDIGGLRTRYPFALQTGPLAVSDGTTITGADVRRVVENGNELLLFTKSKLYSRNVQLQKWVDKGTHLAAKLTEQNAFVTGGQQTNIDRAELNNVVLYSWDESGGAYVGAKDKTTGSVLVAPTALGSGKAKARLVALSTKILIFFNNSNTGFLNVLAIDPADPATGIAAASTAVGSAANNNVYDATRILGTDTAVIVQQLLPTTSYGISTVTAGLTIVNSTKARVCDGPIAVASSPTGTHVQVARTNFGATAIQGDYIAVSGLADVTVAQAIGAAPDSAAQIAAAYRSVQDSSQYRCYVFWSDGTRSTDGAGIWRTSSNWVDTGGTIGTAAVFLRRLDVGSRAFDHDGRVYVWMIWGMAAGTYGWGGELQNASFLYRDDAFLVAKSAWNRGGGFLTVGHLPGVAGTGTATYSYAGTERVVFGELTGSSFSGKRPRDVTVAFDSNEARRCVRVGRTLVVTGGEILQYDGVRITELGFHVWPWYFLLANGAGGSLENGTYAYKSSYHSTNAQAEIDRSAAIRVDQVTISTAPDRVTVTDLSPLYVTHKPALNAEVWRTKKDPNIDDPYYQASTSDPSDTSNPQRYLPNDTTAADLPDMQDDLIDADLSEFGQNPQDNTLPNLAPPAASIIAATETRVFLAGVAGDPHNVWYSKQRAEGEVAAFHGALVAPVPVAGGDITALAFLSETLVVFRESAVYVLTGDGFDNIGGGTNYAARAIPGDVGAVNQESVVEMPDGLLFKSSKGWYLLTRAWTVQYVGAPVAAYDSETPLAAHVMSSQHQVRILTASRMLVFDYLVNQWGEWSIADGVHACMWQGSHVYLASTGVKAQQSTYDEVDYGWDVEGAWIKVNELQGRGIVRAVELLGEWRASHSIRVRIARNYESDGAGGWNYFDDKTVGIPTTTVGGQEQLKIAPSIKRPIQSLKVRLTAMHGDRSSVPSGDTARLTGLSIDVAVEPGLYSGLSAAQKQ